MENFPGKARSNGESFPDVVDVGHEEKAKGDGIVLTGGGSKSDSSLIALWIDGSVCLLLASGDFARLDPEDGSLNFSDGRGIGGSFSGEVLR
jgi:hypothetical protein